MTDNTHQSDTQASWEKHFLKLKENRQTHHPKNHNTVFNKKNNSNNQSESINLVLSKFLHEWQQQHNSQAENTPEAPSDTMLMFAENWLAAQTAIQGDVAPEAVSQQQTIWINPKNTAINQNTQSAAEQPPLSTSGQTASSHHHDALPTEAWPVSVNVLCPTAVKNKQPVFCISEQELIQQLMQRLLPHLENSINGLIRNTIQKQAAHLTYRLETSLLNQVPEIVNDILEHNLKNALSVIKNLHSK